MAEKRYKIVNNETIELTAEEIAEADARHEEAMTDLSGIRQTRNNLLAGCDWTQISDATLGDHTVDEWKTYRQELRDVLSGKTRLDEIVWPDDPPTAVIKAAELAARAAE
tara:strand:+ start:578 stop:907 length:330 start_codon:yes stop_codon:yes gene_type:complete